ncbi:apoptosis-stimulating of p53 protein 2 isoform X2 [Episyrphus balteatus]|uniref:apoptosis-stimulating of p53 protein 2 isoform X2 n=1 Tax=Episyrphus balteatus TaxID=286459 RepID=UPI002485D452|nr:apoptosis-stimulating of p53 protein 2 isoform X2 [Episyrphus balteatus]
MKEPNNFEDIAGPGRTTTQEVPGRPTSAELRAMALRQQQQIDSQHQLLATKEQRLRFLKAQEVRGAAAAAEGERLRRLRERVEAQESKLRRLRALRGQVDLQKTYNVTLSNDLDSIRALFSEKEKELSLAVAKVEALTRQLEDLRRDRRGPLNLIPGNGACNVPQPLPTQAARELEKLRRELMYRNQLSLQQDARLHLQREALQQRQAELRSVDQRIFELQTRLQKKKASNLNLQQQQQNSPQISPKERPQQQKHQQNTTSSRSSSQVKSTQRSSSEGDNKTQQQQSSMVSTNIPLSVRPSNSVYPSQRVVPRGNVAAVEPYIHTPQKSVKPSTTAPVSATHVAKQSAATANTNQQNQLIQDLTNLKINLAHVNSSVSVNHLSYAESDETKLARQKLSALPTGMITTNFHSPTSLGKEDESENPIEISSKKSTVSSSSEASAKATSLPYSSKIPKSISVKPVVSTNNTTTSNECDSEKAGEVPLTSAHQLTVHSTPLGLVNKSVALAVSTATTTSTTTTAPSQQPTSPDSRPAVKPKALHHQIPSGNLVVPPRKPISSVAPTSMTSSIPKIVAHSPKVNKVAPSVIIDSDKSRPALPPKPSKLSPTGSDSSMQVQSTVSTAPTVVSVINKAPISEPNTTASNEIALASSVAGSHNTDNLPIKAKPLTIRKQPLSEQPRLKCVTSGLKPVHQYNSRRIEMPPAFLFPEIDRAELKDKTGASNQSQQQSQHQNQSDLNGNGCSTDELDKAVVIQASEEKSPDDVKHRLKHENGKAKLARRVSFDPLALLLDASLEGELELVKKTAMQVPNPSAANDEGITALHNAICAGHFEIVKFLVEFGCDVNAQDSDGWTPLHCAASCNNLSMVKFLVENGACLFAATLSDHETPAEKCEEDEEGFDGCSEYLYSIQEKLGILHSGEVYAVFSYDAQQSDELSFVVNDRLTILRKGDDAEREWWWAKNFTGEEGYVPRNLLGLYPRVPLQTTNFID